MYGFVEKELAEAMQITGTIDGWEQFSTSDGDVAAIIDADGFNAAIMAIKNVADDFGYSPEDVAIVPSDVAGMRIILHPFWMNDIVFDALTPGSVKESELYLSIRQETSDNRFVWNEFIDYFKAELYHQQDENEDEEEEPETILDPDLEPVRQAQQASPSPAPPPLESDEATKYIESIQRNWGTQFKRVECQNGKTVLVHKGSICLNEPLYEFAGKVGKHVVVIERSTFGDHMKREARRLTKAIRDGVIFLYATPNHPKLYRPDVDITHTLFGCDVSSIYQIHGDRNVNSNYDAMTDPASAGQLFSEFDYIYRDYKTGIIWALQKEKFEIFLTVNMNDVSTRLHNIILGELGDRYDGRLGYMEALKRDLEYFQMSSQYDQENFVKLAVNNSKNLINELKSQHLHAKESYVEHMNQAMEYAKVAQRLEESLLLMDEDKLVNEEKGRCIKMYEDVLTIPQVTAVKVTDETVNVYTHNIYVKHEKKGTWHDIGTFHIQIGMYGTKYDPSRTVRIFNTKHQIHAFEEQMQAPHVFGDGHLCHGNITGAMIDSYKRRDLYQMVLMLIMFVQNANLDDAAGAYLNKWPEVSEEIATKPVEEMKTALIFEDQTEEEKVFDEKLEIPIHI